MRKRLAKNCALSLRGQREVLDFGECLGDKARQATLGVVALDSAGVGGRLRGWAGRRSDHPDHAVTAKIVAPGHRRRGAVGRSCTGAKRG